jgi:hypothetical protein
MKQGPRAVWWLCCITATFAAIVWAWPREPRYEGKSLGQWLADLELDSGADRNARERAVAAVRAMGTNALPRLTRMLCAQDSAPKKLLLAVADKSSMIHLQFTTSRQIQNRALQGYQALGDVATVYLPTLIRLLNDDGSPAQTKACIALALGQMGPAARTAIPALGRATRDTNEEVRLNAILALANIQQNIDRTGGRGW